MPSETLILFPPFRLDMLNAQLWRDNELVPVRPKPFAVLTYLATHTERLVPRAELVKAVWPNTYVSKGASRVYIREVRVVLGDDSETPRFIETVPRRGYRFIAAVTAASVPSSQFQVPSFPSPAPSDIDRRETRSSQLGTWNLKPETLLVGRERELTHRWRASDYAAQPLCTDVAGADAGVGE